MSAERRKPITEAALERVNDFVDQRMLRLQDENRGLHQKLREAQTDREIAERAVRDLRLALDRANYQIAVLKLNRTPDTPSILDFAS